MRGDPNQCREQAVECVRLANEGTAQQSRDDFVGLANVWFKASRSTRERQGSARHVG